MVRSSVFVFVAVLLFATVCFAKAYSGPAKPTIPSDTAAIDTSPAGCRKTIQETVGGDDEAALNEGATKLCQLRTEHKAARERLLAGLAKLVADFREDTNHDHAQRLPVTIKSIQNMVKDCVAALDSQQYCHNFQCNEEPERNYAICETKAADVLDLIVK